MNSTGPAGYWTKELNMLLSYTELCDLVEQGVITDVQPEAINGTSIDVHLGDDIIVETYVDQRHGIVDIAKRTPWLSHTVRLNGTGYRMAPGEFVLASTVERAALVRSSS